MSGFNGRDFTFDWDSVTLVGVRSRTLSASNDLVDVTTDDDEGWRTLLANPGLRSVEVTIAGICSDEVLIADMYAVNVAAAPMSATLPVASGTAGSIAGSFVLSSFEQSGEHDGAYEFSATFMSSGAVTYTASS